MQFSDRAARYQNRALRESGNSRLPEPESVAEDNEEEENASENGRDSETQENGEDASQRRSTELCVQKRGRRRPEVITKPQRLPTDQT